MCQRSRRHSAIRLGPRHPSYAPERRPSCRGMGLRHRVVQASSETSPRQCQVPPPKLSVTCKARSRRWQAGGARSGSATCAKPLRVHRRLARSPAACMPSLFRSSRPHHPAPGVFLRVRGGEFDLCDLEATHPRAKVWQSCVRSARNKKKKSAVASGSKNTRYKQKRNRK